MSEEDRSHRAEAKSDADRTLLGVAPPRIDSSAELLPRAPIFVRSGTSVADIEAAPTSHVAPPSKAPPALKGASEIPVAIPSTASASAIGEVSERVLSVARRRPVLWMVLAPVLVAVFGLWLGHHGHARAAVAANAERVSKPIDPPMTSVANAAPISIAALEAKAPESLSSRELVLLADARAERRLLEARTLRRRVEDQPTLAKDSAVRSELLRLAGDDLTARDALAAMTALASPVGADLLYETWTGTPDRSETTELARALVYSAEVRPTASPALAVALELRAAATCENYQAVLPHALKDGDRRSWHLLTKLEVKRGCGPQKTADCFPCLRAQSDELTATINAVKSRTVPNYAAE